MTRDEIRTVSDLTKTVAADFAEVMRRADRERGRVVLCLSGGGTPLPIYRALARTEGLPWARTWVAWGDERFVPPDHEDRNEKATYDALLNHVPVPDDQVLTWPWSEEATPEACAEAYETRLRSAFGDPEEETWFDLNLMGLGPDAHTASLFPGTGGTRAPGFAVATHPANQPTARTTLTPPALSSSRFVWFVIEGDAKRAALQASLQGTDPEATPAITISAREELRVYTDLEV